MWRMGPVLGAQLPWVTALFSGCDSICISDRVTESPGEEGMSGSQGAILYSCPTDSISPRAAASLLCLVPGRS